MAIDFTPAPQDWTGGPDPDALPSPATPLPEQQRQHRATQPQPPAPQDWTGGPSPDQPLPSIMAGSDARDAFLRGTGLGTRDVLEGGTSVPAKALDVLTWPGRAAERVLGLPVGTPPSEWVQKGIDVTGLPTPQTEGEKFRSSIIKPLASVPAMLAGGGLLATGAEMTGLPGVSTAIDILSGGAKAAPEASLPARLAVRGASLGTQGAASGSITGAAMAPDENAAWNEAMKGAVAGGIAGPVLGAAAYPVRALAGMLPDMMPSLTRAGLAAKMLSEGIDLDPAQLTTNPTYKIIADQLGKLPGSGVAGKIAQTRGQWANAVADTFGESAPNGITNSTMENAATRISGMFKTAAQGTTITGGTPLITDMGKIAADIPRFGLTADQMAPVRAQFRNVMDAFDGGNKPITGDTYLSLTARGGPLDTAIGNADPTVSLFARRIKDALDDAFERSAPEQANLIQQARAQYRNMKTVEPLVAKEGATGDLSPATLQARVIAQSRKWDSSTGGIAYGDRGPLGDLAAGGHEFMGGTPDSGTLARSLSLAGLGSFIASPVGTIAAAPKIATALAVNRGLQAAIRSSGVGRNMIENTVVPHLVAPTGAGITPYGAAATLPMTRGLLDIGRQY